MFNYKKLFLLSASSLIISLNILTHASHINDNKPNICDFDPERDTQPIIDIFNQNRSVLSSHDDSFPYQSFLESCHSHPSCTIKVLRENEELAGYIAYQKGWFSGRIEQLAIKDNFRNKGYGTLLLSTALKELNDKDIDYIELACYENNNPAVHLYQKMGFKKTDECRDGTSKFRREKNPK